MDKVAIIPFPAFERMLAILDTLPHRQVAPLFREIHGNVKIVAAPPKAASKSTPAPPADLDTPEVKSDSPIL